MPSGRNPDAASFEGGAPGANDTYQTAQARERVGTPLDDVPVDGLTAQERADPNARVATPKTHN